MRKQFFLSAILLCCAVNPLFGSCSSSPCTVTGGSISLTSTSSGPALNSSQITVSGFASGSSIGHVTMTLTDWTETDGGNDDREFFLVYQPTGSSSTYTMEVASEFGNFYGFTNVNLTLDDAASAHWVTSVDTAENSNTSYTYQPTASANASYLQDPTSGLASANTNFAAPGGTATLGSVFNGTPANGTWTLYVYDHLSDDAAASIGSWAITVTTASASTTSTNVTSSTGETFEGSGVNFTATVLDTQNSGTTVSSGTVTFTDETTGTVLSSGVAVSNGQAILNSVTFATEGKHVIQAQYNGNATFGPSSNTVSVFIDHVTTNPSTGTYCNTGTNTVNTSNGGATGAAVFPQHIFISGQTGSITGISLQTPNLQNVFLPDLNFLLVGPSGTTKFVALSGAGSSSQVPNGTNLTLADGAPIITSAGIASGTYGPTDITASPVFGSGPAGPYSQPKTAGSATFATTFGGDSLNGTWSLYIYDTKAGDTSSVSGYCLAFTTSTEPSTTTALTSNPATNATVGQQVTFTATVTSNSVAVTQGTVTFEESGNIVSGPTALNGSGQATYQTSTLAEGIHNITAIYNGVAGTFNVSSSSVTIEVDTPTTNPSTGVYCNPGGITLGANANATPYPSRITVTNLAGTVSAVTATLNNFSSTDMFQLSMMLEGPTATNVVLSHEAGPATTSIGPLNLTFEDSASGYLPSTFPSSGPYAYKPTTSNTSGNPFPSPAPLPDYSGPAGSQTLTTAFAASGGINPNGYWSLFVVDGGQTGSIGNWCLNFTENPPVLSIAKSHTGSFTQGDTSDKYTITVANPSGPGSTAGTLTLKDTLPTGLTAISMSETGNTGGGTGSDWSCVAGTTTCTRTTPMAAGETDTITLTVSVSYSAAVGTNAVTNSVSVSGGGAATQTATDPTTIIQGPGFTLTTVANPTQAGTVAANPANSAGFTAGHYVPGTVVTLTATANTGYGFSSWSGSADLTSTSANPTTVTMNANENITANFTQSNVTVTLNTSPQGLLVSVDGGPAQAAPLSESWQVGSQHTIATTTPQGSAGTQYVFASWSDGGALSHSITVPSAAKAYTATFNTQYLLTVNASPSSGGTASPASGTYYAAATVVNLSATANAGYAFSSWTGPVANATSASTTVTMTAPETVTANFTSSGGTSLGGSIGLKSGPENARVWPFTVGNNGPGAATNAQITSLTLTQTRGAACTPVIATAFPLVVGNIAPGSTTTGNVTIDFSSCATGVAFTASAPLSANGGAATGSIVKLNQLP